MRYLLAAILGLSIGLMTACAPHVASSPMVPAPRVPDALVQSAHAARIVIGIDVPQATELCFVRTMPMYALDPTLPELICMETVGGLRQRYVFLRAAD